MIRFKNKWEHHETEHTIIIEDGRVIANYDIITFYGRENYVKLEGIYVQPKYRNKGWFNKIIEDIIYKQHPKDCIDIVVYKGSWIIEKYRKLDFVDIDGPDEGENYSWMRLT